MTGEETERPGASAHRKAAMIWAGVFVVAMFGTPFLLSMTAMPPGWKQFAMLMPMLLLIPMVRASYAAQPGGMGAPTRRYMIRLFTAMGVYMVSLFAAKYLLKHHMVEGWAVWPLALLPGLSVVGAFYAVGMLIIEQKDEYIRMLLVRQTLVASALALAAATVWGFLENFGLVDHIDAFYWAIVWFFGLGVGAIFNRITVGSWGGC
ncbi:MAG TPA: hypothetical protein VGE65_06875 [Sphingobium sp.]